MFDHNLVYNYYFGNLMFERLLQHQYPFGMEIRDGCLEDYNRDMMIKL
jgi:hypothetical protein